MFFYLKLSRNAQELIRKIENNSTLKAPYQIITNNITAQTIIQLRGIL
jgi:hypothetical protein